MKKENRYTQAIEQIAPDENFVNDTVQKLAKSKPRRSFVQYALPALTILVVAFVAVSIFSKFIDKKGSVIKLPSATVTPNASPDRTADTEQKTQDRNANVSSTAMPALAPAPNANAYESAVEYEEDAYAFDLADGEYGMFYWPSESMLSGSYWNTEEYSTVTESGFRYAVSSPLSTFAADVDTAGYTTVRRKLLEQTIPDENAVRIEELLNYFHYNGLAPQDGSPLKISAYLDACPWNEEAALLFVGIGAQKIDTDDLPSSNLVFLIDTSGSMDGSDRLDLAKRAFHLLSDTLRAGDKVSVVTYSGSFSVLLEGVDASEKQTILDAIDSLEAWGSTNGGDAIVTAYSIAEKNFIAGGNNRVIMMTDGDLNVGITSESELVGLIEEKKNSGVFLSVLGFGMGNYKDNKLEALADHGNGVYSYIDGITEARRVLVTEMGANFYTVAKDVKIQVEFNPEYVSRYRLIGYENRSMAAEDFSDDTKDGGEMGSGHTVVALYELIPAEGRIIAGVSGKISDTAAPALRYQESQPAGLEEVAQISLRYKQPDGVSSEMISCTVNPEDIAEGEQARNLLKASAVAEFGMLLRNSEYKGSATYDSAFRLISGLENLDAEESELMYLINVARNLKQ